MTMKVRHKAYPDVVDAVTLTIIIVAGERIFDSSSFCFARSTSFPSAYNRAEIIILSREVTASAP